jgi:hypothetical protein
MESKGGKKKSSSKSLFYETPLGYSIEDVRPNGGIKKFRSAAYCNVSLVYLSLLLVLLMNLISLFMKIDQ